MFFFFSTQETVFFFSQERDIFKQAFKDNLTKQVFIIFVKKEKKSRTKKQYYAAP